MTAAPAPLTKSLIIWETGASTLNLTEAQQAQWAKQMMKTACSEGIAGFNWWEYIDWAKPTHACPTLTQCQQEHFGAHFVDGTPKAVWSVLGEGHVL